MFSPYDMGVPPSARYVALASVAKLEFGIGHGRARIKDQRVECVHFTVSCGVGVKGRSTQESWSWTVDKRGQGARVNQTSRSTQTQAAAARSKIVAHDLEVAVAPLPIAGKKNTMKTRGVSSLSVMLAVPCHAVRI